MLLPPTGHIRADRVGELGLDGVGLALEGGTRSLDPGGDACDAVGARRLGQGCVPRDGGDRTLCPDLLRRLALRDLLLPVAHVQQLGDALHERAVEERIPPDRAEAHRPCHAPQLVGFRGADRHGHGRQCARHRRQRAVARRIDVLEEECPHGAECQCEIRDQPLVPHDQVELVLLGESRPHDGGGVGTQQREGGRRRNREVGGPCDPVGRVLRGYTRRGREAEQRDRTPAPHGSASKCSRW